MPQRFYDELAPFYHLIFADWEASIARQAYVLDRLLQQTWGHQVASVLDVACGIGTQALGLAGLGYTVSASDLSPQAVGRAREEASRRGLAINFSVADMRQAHEHHKQTFDVLIACDNAVPHLLSDADILDAFKSFYRCLRPGGGCLLSVRDYDQEVCTGVQVKPYGIREQDGATYLVFQVWTFEGAFYDLAMYFIRDDGGSEGVAHIFRTRYYAVSPNRLMELLQEAGFHHVRRVDGEYYQPVILGSK